MELGHLPLCEGFEVDLLGVGVEGGRLVDVVEEVSHRDSDFEEGSVGEGSVEEMADVVVVGKGLSSS